MNDLVVYFDASCVVGRVATYGWVARLGRWSMTGVGVCPDNRSSLYGEYHALWAAASAVVEEGPGLIAALSSGCVVFRGDCEMVIKSMRLGTGGDAVATEYRRWCTALLSHLNWRCEHVKRSNNVEANLLARGKMKRQLALR